MAGHFSRRRYVSLGGGTGQSQVIRALRMLDCEDDKLWRWSMGYEECPDVELVALLRKIAAMPA